MATTYIVLKRAQGKFCLYVVSIRDRRCHQGLRMVEGNYRIGDSRGGTLYWA
jgi:hypothetical protein